VDSGAAFRHRSLGRVAMLGADITRTALAAVDAGHHHALGGDAGVLVVADLAHGRSRRPRDVRLATGLTTGGVSNLLARLEAAGVITRAGDDHADRRAVRVEPTVYGRAVAGDVSAAVLRGVRRCTAAVTELVALLEHLGADRGRSGRDRLLPARAAVPPALAALSTALAEALTTPSTDPTAALVLLAVAETGACRPRYLGARLGLSSAGVSATLDRLERVGLVAREVSSDVLDQRATIAGLTAPGARVGTEVADGVDRSRDALLAAGLRLASALVGQPGPARIRQWRPGR
jgi:DNA-binding MarR family transcriptional regulator